MAETAEQKVEKDLKTLPKSVPTPKPLNYVGNPDPEVQATRFGNLELRADLESRLALSPVAQLGYDIIERGLLEPTAGEMGGDIVPMFRPPGVVGNIKGRALPSKRLNPDDDITDVDYMKENQERYPVTTRNLARYGKGIESLLPSGRGSTVTYDTSEGRDKYLNTLMEELAHIGVRELQRRGVDVGNVPIEERAMDMLQSKLALNEGMEPESDQQAIDMETMKEKYISVPRSLLGDYNEAALAVLDERGVPRRAVPKRQETGMVDSMLNFFGLK